MTFGSPIALIGLLAALSPILIYILLRRQRNRVDWGASYLLRLTLSSKRKSSRWKQLVVLACRALILALMALLLAHAILPKAQPAMTHLAPPTEPVHRLVIVDHSLSMTLVDDGASSRQSRQWSAIESLAESQRPYDLLTFISLSQPETPLAQWFGKPAEDDLRQLRQALTPVEGKAQLLPALRSAIREANISQDHRHELLIFSDYSTDIMPSAPLEPMRPLLAETFEDILLTDFSISSGTQQANIVITNVDTGGDRVWAGLPFSLQFSATNFSDVPGAAHVSITAGDQELATRDITLGPGESKRLQQPLTLSKTGTALLQLSSKPTLLERYASNYVALEVHDKLKLWIIADEGQSSSENLPSDSDFLARAVDAITQSGAMKIEQEPITFGQVRGEVPADVDLILVVGLSHIPPAANAVFQQFVRRGGGVIFTASPAVKTASWQDAIADLLPVALTAMRYPETDYERFDLLKADVSPNESWLRHALLGAEDEDLNSARFYNLLASTPIPGAMVPLALPDGTPVLASRTLGRGVVLFTASTLGAEWNSLPVRQSFVPFWLTLLRYANQGAAFPRNLSVGDTLLLPWPDEAPTLTGGSGSVELLKYGESAFAATTPLGEPGVYRLVSASRRDVAVVRKEVIEGDLRHIAPARLEPFLAAFQRPLQPSWTATVSAYGTADAAILLWPWVLAAILLLYLFECWFVRLL